MYEKGYERKSRLLALQRAEAELTGQEGELLSQIARAEEQIGETKLQIINITVKRKEDIDQQLSETQARRAEVEQQIGRASIGCRELPLSPRSPAPSSTCALRQPAALSVPARRCSASFLPMRSLSFDARVSHRT